MGTKKGRIYGKGALLTGGAQRFWGGSCPKLPLPGTATDTYNISSIRFTQSRLFFSIQLNYHFSSKTRFFVKSFTFNDRNCHARGFWSHDRP